MKASALVFKLQELIQNHGDLRVVDDEDTEVDVEFSPADQLNMLEPAFIVE